MLTVLFLYINEIYTWAVLLISTREALCGGEQFSSTGPRIQAMEDQNQRLCFIRSMLIKAVGFGVFCVLKIAGRSGFIAKCAINVTANVFC